MTAYVSVPASDRDPESPLNAALVDALYNNPIAITEGAAGAPKHQTASYADASVTNEKLAVAAAGDVICGGSNLILSTQSTTYVKTIEFFVPRAGTYRITFNLAEDPAVASNLAYARVYRNGVAVGTERTDDDAAPTPFTEDLGGWAAGDLLQIYQKVDIGAGGSKVTDLRIKASFFVHAALSTLFTPVT